MCLDDNKNIEINKKMQLDCCTEETHRFDWSYNLNEDTITIFSGDPGKETEKYIFKIISDTLLLLPLINHSIEYCNDSVIAIRPMLKYRRTRY